MAFSFLTRVPVPVRVRDVEDLASSIHWFPVAGAMIGVVIGGAYSLVSIGLGPVASAAIAVSFGIMLTGAFHEDGLADTFDALGGGGTSERSLEIMKDSRLGAFGTAALVSSIVIRVGLVAGFDGRMALFVLPAAHAVSRAAAVGVMGVSPAAASEGLGASYLRHVTSTRVLLGALVGVGAGIALLGPVAGIAACAAAAMTSLVVRRWALRKIGGVTGDVLGAVQQIAEVGVLFAAAWIPGEPFSPW